jgi:PAS domain S-box-containing protein
MMFSSRHRYALVVAGLYTVLALAWIFLSDALLQPLGDVATVLWLSNLKGSFFVVSSAVVMLLAVVGVPRGDAQEAAAAQRIEGIVGNPVVWLAHASAVGLAGLMLAVCSHLPPEHHATLIVLMLLPVAVAGLAGGLWPALLATAVGSAGLLSFSTHPSTSAFAVLLSGAVASVVAEVCHRAQRRAQADRMLLDAVVAGTSDCVFVKDLQGRYLLLNAAAAAVTGRPASESLGRDDHALFPEAAQVVRRSDEAALQAGRTLQTEEQVTTPAGETVDFLVTKGPVRNREGRVVGVFGIARDITARKRADAELDQHRHHLTELVDTRTRELEQAKEDAERAHRSECELLAHISHEVRTPMNAILGMTRVLSASTLDARQLDRLGKIDHAARHLLQVLNDILDRSRLEAGRMPIERIEVGWPEVQERVSAVVGEAARGKGLALRWDTAALPPRLATDPTRLAQVLVNLVGNAIKFTALGGVTVRAWADAPAGAEQTLHFEVIDTGEGLAPQQLERLFTPYGQADSSVARRHGGTGLGLALCRDLVRLMGGEIGVTSGLGEGSRFWFTVRAGVVAPPVTRLEPAAAVLRSPEQVLRERHAGQRVLLVDDNAINREVGRELLRAAGLDVVIASDGAEAVAMVEAHAPALVLMDVQMPRLDGLEATRRIRAVHGERLPIVAMTASEVDEDQLACRAAGMDDQLPKPVEPAVLYRCLLRWLPAR